MFWNKESNLKIKFNKKNWKDNKYFYNQATEG